MKTIYCEKDKYCVKYYLKDHVKKTTILLGVVTNSSYESGINNMVSDLNYLKYIHGISK